MLWRDASQVVLGFKLARRFEKTVVVCFHSLFSHWHPQPSLGRRCSTQNRRHRGWPHQTPRSLVQQHLPHLHPTIHFLYHIRTIATNGNPTPPPQRTRSLNVLHSILNYIFPISLPSLPQTPRVYSSLPHSLGSLVPVRSKFGSRQALHPLHWAKGHSMSQPWKPHCGCT